MLYCMYHPEDEIYHKFIVNYRMIAAGDVANAIALRVFEQRTEQRIALLRKRYGISEDELPPDEWLWLDESDVSPSVMTIYAGGLRGRVTLTRTIAERSPNPNRPSLIELGIVQSRYIAKRGYYARGTAPLTTLYTDWQGERYAVVDDWQGYYLDETGELHDATEEGYMIITKQYRLKFEVANADIAKRHGSVPPVLPRWKKSMAPAQETPIADVVRSGCHASDTRSHQDLLRGNFTSACESISTKNDITDAHQSSISASDEGDLRQAPWTPDTFTRLVTHTLQDCAPYATALPDRASCDPEAWRTKVQEPLERLMASVAMLPAPRAWEQVDLTIRYMCTPGSPSWWQRNKAQGGRTTKASITIKQIADRRVIEWEDYLRHDWHPGQTTPYDGPALLLEEGVAAPARTQEPDTDALPVVACGMLRSDAQALRDEIWRQVPELRLSFLPVEDDGEESRVVVGFEYAEGKWHDLCSAEEWRNQRPKLRKHVAAALALHCVHAHDASAEMVPEPPIVATPPEQITMSDDELLEEDRHPHTEKHGMGTIVADLLQEQIRQERPDLVIMPHPVGERVVLMVQDQGVWAEIDSALAWRDYRAANPPIGVLLTGGADGQGGAMDGAP